MILAEPLKTRSTSEITKAWMQLHKKLSGQGTAPSIYIIDNEACNELKTALKKKQLTYQLVPPHVHRQNAAERAIRTYKNHLLTILAGADKEYPVSEWDQFLPHCEMTLNLLRNSRVNPKLSSYASLLATLISIKHHLHHSERKSLYISRQINEPIGTIMAKKCGILDRRWNIIDVSNVTFQMQKQPEMLTLLIFSKRYSISKNCQ